MAEAAAKPGKALAEHAGKLDIAFYACLFYYFVEYFRPHQKYAIFKGIPFGDISAGLFIICFLLAGRRIEVKNRINFLVGLYFSWILVCSLAGVNFSTSWEFIIYFFKFFLVYFLTVNTITSEKQLIWFIFFIALLYFSYTNFALRSWVLSGFSGSIRGAYYGAGFFANPNDMSAALSSFFGLSLYMIFADKYRLFNKFPNKWFHVVNTALTVLGVLITSTRGGAVALAACLLYFWKKKRFQVKYFLLLLLVGVSFFAMLSEAQLEKFERIGTEQDESGQDRLDNWAIAWKMMNDYPVFGVGPWNYVEAKKKAYNE
ncbi:MAG: O-antigen ligase family protein, partial [Desulfobacteraceae bacterium]|nr:O-antigen ligase family protein [Desulfobacteraceae bacterium]